MQIEARAFLRIASEHPWCCGWLHDIGMSLLNTSIFLTSVEYHLSTAQYTAKVSLGPDEYKGPGESHGFVTALFSQETGHLRGL